MGNGAVGEQSVCKAGEEERESGSEKKTWRDLNVDR